MSGTGLTSGPFRLIEGWPSFLAFLGLVLAISLTLLPAPASAQRDTCQYALDNECDEARYNGTGACAAGTDTSDCRLLSTGRQTNECQWAFDGECDEPLFSGTGACLDGSDSADCAPVVAQNSCPYAFDNECDEPRFGGTGACENFTDTADCLGGGGGGGGVASVPGLGNDSCQWAYDLECDDIRYGGTGACREGTDASDCRALAAGGDNSCEWAFDNECDEPNIGLGVCASGSDTADCQSIAFLRNRENTCQFAFDGQCDEPGGGTGRCGALSDTADCIGRNRPPEAYDHYFGRDDRVLPDSNAAPWRSIGLLDLPDTTCTGSLVGPRTVLTAAHCVLSEDGSRIVMPLSFRAGASGNRSAAEARVVDAFAAPDYAPDAAAAGRGNGNDWAYVTLDRDIGNQVGYLPIHVLSQADLSVIDAGGLLVDQAGYSWDTGEFLSGHRSCRVVDSFQDGTILHECDTTHGDSGSPILLMVNGQPHIIAVDSQFFDPQDRNTAFTSANLAVDSRAFARALGNLRTR